MEGIFFFSLMEGKLEPAILNSNPKSLGAVLQGGKPNPTAIEGASKYKTVSKERVNAACFSGLMGLSSPWAAFHSEKKNPAFSKDLH